ncbi:MAG: class I mannose-6-phosphate isomerase [Lachnospiraceae bacterium]|nr:class I mannose-6-phosphate isomerase [Lachnospiraceae bacterium]
MGDERFPFLLSGVSKEYIWGGTKLIREYARPGSWDTMAEYWECSTHPDGISRAASGRFKGEALDVILRSHPEYIGHKAVLADSRHEGSLPILVKLIDATQDLSIQVHPDDDFAMIHENGQRGKSEFWYILETEPDAGLIYGFYRDITPDTLRKALQGGTVSNYVQRVPVSRDDIFYVEAGTVHAICAGTVLAEIQESSNLTYRLYDYDRTDKNGLKRELHIDKAMQVLDYSASPQPRQPMRLIRYIPGMAEEFLFRCRYFEVARLLVLADTDPGAGHRSGPGSFEILLCIDGAGRLSAPGMDDIAFAKGDCIFIPAGSVPMKLFGHGSLLKIHC